MRFVRIIIYCLTLVLFFRGLLEASGIPLVLLKSLSEFCVVIGFILLLSLKIRIIVRPNTLIFTFLYFAAIITSVITTQGSIIDGLKYFRYLAYVVLLLILFNSVFQDKIYIEKYMRFMYYIFIVQIAYAFLEIVFIGVEEEVVGTIFLNGGEYATILPLIILAYSTFYYTRDGSRIHLWIGLLSILIGFASAKRGILFYFPVSVVLLFLLHRSKKHGSIASFLLGTVLFTILLPVIGILARFNTGIASSGDGAFSSFVAAATYAQEYSAGIDFRGYTIGRLSTSINVLLHSLSLNANTLFGHGPGILLGNSGDFEPYKIDYGIVGWSKSILSIGWFGLLTELLLIKEIFVVLKKSVIPGSASLKDNIFYRYLYVQGYLIYFFYSVLLSASFYLFLPYIGILTLVRKGNTMK